MTNFNLEDSKLILLNNNELKEFNGGFISYLSVFKEVLVFAAGEVTDLIDGFKSGYNAATQYQIQ